MNITIGKTIIIKLFLAAFCCMHLIWAQTDAERKATFDAILPPGTYALMVWQKEIGEVNGDPDHYRSNMTELKLLDTRTGAVKVIKNSAANCRWLDASFTKDGKSIVYFNLNNHEIRIMNADGTNDRTLVPANRYYQLGRTWQSTDGKQYIIAVRNNPPNVTNYRANTSVYRVSVDNIADTLLLGSRISETVYAPNWGEPKENSLVDWASVTSDGKYIVGGFCRYSEIGFYSTVKKEVTKFAPTGCWTSAAPDNSLRVLYQDADLRHLKLKSVLLPNQTDPIIYDLEAKGYTNSTSGIYENNLRWTSHVNYATLQYYETEGNAKVYTGLPNPALLRLSDLKQATVYNKLAGSTEGNADAFIYGAAQARITSKLTKNLKQGMGTFYDLNGKQVSFSANKGNKNIYIVKRGFNITKSIGF